MFFSNNFGDYLNDWRKIQKEINEMERISPKAYGELLSKRRKRKKRWEVSDGRI